MKKIKAFGVVRAATIVAFAVSVHADSARADDPSSRDSYTSPLTTSNIGAKPNLFRWTAGSKKKIALGNMPGHPAPATNNAGVYVVQPGDTVYAIMRRSGVTFRKIVSLNNLEAPYLIKIGQILALK
jgi:LysM repeat protein